MTDKPDPTTIKDGEYHPAADSAMNYIRSLGMGHLLVTREALASSSIEGDRLSEICGGTLERILDGAPVSDRYLLGLAWTLKMMEEARDR